MPSFPMNGATFPRRAETSSLVHSPIGTCARRVGVARTEGRSLPALSGRRRLLPRCARLPGDMLWPAERIGVVSLFCPSNYARGKQVGFHAEDRGWDTWGAQAYLFPYQSAEMVLTSPLFVQHRRSGPSGGNRNIDSVVGHWCRESRMPYFVHAPSLVEHVGVTSTLYPTAGIWGNRATVDFVGEQCDVSSSLATSESNIQKRKP